MKKKALHCVILFISAAILIICLTCMITGLRMLKIQNKMNQIDQGKIYIRLQHESNPLKLPENHSTIDNMRSMYDEMVDIIDPADYYEIYRQGLEIGEAQVMCMQLSLNVQTDFDFAVSGGRLFAAEDYAYEYGASIPVIIGSNVDALEIGDTFEAGYLFDQYKFVVIGILQPGTSLPMSFQAGTLDDYLIIPSIMFLDYPETADQYASQRIHHANKLSGIIKLNSSEQYAQMIPLVTDYLDRSAIGSFSWYTSSMFYNYLNAGFNLKWFAIMIVVLLFISFIVFIASSIAMRKNTTIFRQAFCFAGLTSGVLCFFVTKPLYEFLGLKIPVLNYVMIAVFLIIVFVCVELYAKRRRWQ